MNLEYENSNIAVSEVAALSNVLNCLKFRFYEDAIYGIADAMRFYLKKDIKNKIEYPITSIYGEELIDSFLKNTRLKSRIIETPKTKAKIKETISEELKGFSIILTKSIDIDNNNNKVEHFFTISPTEEENQYLIGINSNDEIETTSLDEVVDLIATNKKIINSYIFEKQNNIKKIEIKVIAKGILKENAKRFLTDENHGIGAMKILEKKIPKYLRDPDKFKAFAAKFNEIWTKDGTNGSGHRALYYLYLNVLIKRVDDSTGEIKCAHEIYKEMKDRWIVFNNKLQEIANAEEITEEMKEDIMHRFYFNTDESEQLAMTFLNELK